VEKSPLPDNLARVSKKFSLSGKAKPTNNENEKYKDRPTHNYGRWFLEAK
jgi:hypothetical protein